MFLQLGDFAKGSLFSNPALPTPLLNTPLQQEGGVLFAKMKLFKINLRGKGNC